MIVDLRSDTVTRPTPAMYEAMRTAALGDDVLGDDPTVIELEQESAALMGMEAGLFVPSGTMGNQIALACQTERGDCVLFEEEAHMLYYEVGAPGVIAQVVTRTCPSVDGVMEPEEVEKRLQVTSLHTPGTTVICLENTHNRAGGKVIPMETLRAYREIADKNGVRLHLDGARVFNAAVWLGVEPGEITRYVDSVSFCLSKALGAPVGSVLCGTAEMISKARRWRKRLGGGMRQSGLLAACGLIGLREIRHQLDKDHQRARALAIGLQDVPGARVDLNRQWTNFVMVDLETSAPEASERLKEHGVLCLAFGPKRLRLVTHYDVTDEGIEHALNAFRKVV